MKTFIYICLLFLLSGVIQAQDKGGVFYLNGGGGLHTLQYDLQNGNRDNGFGVTVNAGYDYFFNSNWGIGTGFGLRLFQSEGTLNFLSITDEVDSDGESYKLSTDYDNWKEKQNAIFLDIPVGLSYQKEMNEKWGVLATIGAKFSFPAKATYQTAGGNIETSGYYQSTDVVLQNLPQHNFLSVTDMPDDDISFKVNTSAFLDLGVTRGIKENLDLYIGAYACYGLSNAIDSDIQPVYQVNGTYNGMLASNQTDKVIPVSVGVKVGLRWKQRSNITDEIIESMMLEEIKESEKQPVAEGVVPEVKEKAKESKVDEKSPITTLPVIPEKPMVYEPDTAMVIYFKLGTDEVIEKLPLRDLKVLKKQLETQPDLRLHLVGHTCDLGKNKSNFRIALERAYMLKLTMLKLGVSEGQITIESKSFREPAVPNTTEENRAKNRRVELILK